MQLSVTQPDGSVEMRSKSFLHTEASFFPMMQVRILEGLSPEEAIKKYGAPFYINENYARWMNIRPEDIGTKTLQALDENYKSNANAAKNILAGIIENMPTNSLQEHLMHVQVDEWLAFEHFLPYSFHLFDGLFPLSGFQTDL